jgi:periplasmic copper chaperone A
MLLRLRRAALAVLAVVVAVLALGVGTASAHVSVSSPDAAPGGFAEITFRVPSESDTAKTTSLRVQLPTDTPFAFVSVKPVPGWTATATTTTLDTPVEAEGATISEAVTEVTWTADQGGGLAPGEYQSFSISAGPLPEDADSLVFPALQGYDDGTEVSWIEPTVEGQPEPEAPAPVLGLSAASSDAATGDTTSSAPAASDSDSGTSGLAVTALVVGIAGLLAGIAGVALALSARRRSAAPVASAAQERDRAAV